MIKLTLSIADMKKPITCPKYRNDLRVNGFLQDRKNGYTSGLCPSCKTGVSITLPQMLKKLVYLDQSFLSAVCLDADNPNCQQERSILKKLLELKAEQKIVIVVSDIHSRETAGIPDQYISKSEKLWEFQNDLADGNIASDWSEVFIAQHRRKVVSDDQVEQFSIEDIGLIDPHKFYVGTRIQLKNQWQIRLNRDCAYPRSDANKVFRDLLERQKANAPSCRSSQDCLNYIATLWQLDFRAGIEYARQQGDLPALNEHMIRELDAGRIPTVPILLPSGPYGKLIEAIVQGSDKGVRISKLSEAFDRGFGMQSANVRLRIAFEAELLWKLCENAAPNNSDKFNERFGVSRQNDIEHVATLIPYVDVLTTDNEMHSLCKQGIPARELKKFSCRIFSKDTYVQFDSWLDALLIAPKP